MAKRVLIVDDDHFFKKLMGSLFCDMGCDVSTTGDGREAVVMLKGERFDLAVVDYHIPGTAPAGIIDSLRVNAVETPVVIVTADDTVETERRARSLGVAYYFVKPFRMDDLRAVAEKLFASGGAHEGARGRPHPRRQPSCAQQRGANGTVGLHH